MKISCCIFDMDGTLLTSENKISETDKKTLLELNREGVVIALATGRSHFQVLEYIDQLGISSPIITCNGAKISNPLTGEVISNRLLPPEDAKRLIDYAKRTNKEYLMYTDDYLYFAENGNRYNFYMNYNNNAPKKYKLPIRLVSEYPENSPCDNISKILYYDHSESTENLEKIFNEHNTLTITSSFTAAYEIMRAGTSKGIGVETLAKHLNIPMNEVVVFGDNENDRSMFETSAFSVAMGNGTDNIKAIADFVTKTNDECGITYALEQLMKQ